MSFLTLSAGVNDMIIFENKIFMLLNTIKYSREDKQYFLILFGPEAVLARDREIEEFCDF